MLEISVIPFPHAVLDNYFERELLSSCNREFDIAGGWHHSDTPPEKKWSTEWVMGGTAIHDYFNRIAGVEFTTMVADLFDLPHDLSFNGYGGGLHRMEVGDHLDSHVDFTRIGEDGPYRRVNTLTYISPEWQPGWGGELVITDGDDTKIIDPVFGRTVIFPVSETSWHQATRVNQSSRRSLAAYLFSNSAPPDYAGFRSTKFRSEK